ncbi:exported protein of unknown function [endosymbiont DhMRE of Dentiscutata heterogama]|nr:exported protein of unknown function [endosymbiont DhMRE of Dentiscutata heterogama]CFW92868.1 exported protein of unknown function [endosymbiont DhMRE of Dentiscutata heterogama]CFW93112.1 exported protein of unknown function [endosymbiont DhMRE of Dentiscutata heterogama]
MIALAEKLTPYRSFNINFKLLFLLSLSLSLSLSVSPLSLLINMLAIQAKKKDINKPTPNIAHIPPLLLFLLNLTTLYIQ